MHEGTNRHHASGDSKKQCPNFYG
uniref:Uncharacterized protein n=1 Tax=Rhizophora mucronata TaxID=61149 RepID=A0A2P2Q899_RHIMU